MTRNNRSINSKNFQIVRIIYANTNGSVYQRQLNKGESME